MICDKFCVTDLRGDLRFHEVKVVQEREKCIGCGSCAALCPDFWEMVEDGKATLKNSVKKAGENYELEIADIGCNQEAADSCPVECILIIK